MHADLLIPLLPQVLLLTMAAVPPMEWSLLQREVFSVLLPLYLANNQANTQVGPRRGGSGRGGGPSVCV